jgi:DNA-binding LacI/PurR family transcriptional regulator
MPTIRDVAKACGVCPSTVSQVLSNNRPVSRHTRERVLKTIRAMNFRPNAVARGLAIKRMHTLGIVIAEEHASPIRDHYFGSILDGILANARDRRQNATIYLAQYGLPLEEKVASFCDGRSDGIILIAPTKEGEVIAAVKQRHIPFVVVGDSSPLEGVTAIDTDHEASSRKLVEHVIAAGHRRIAIIVGSEVARCSWQRRDGWRSALESSGISVDERLMVQGSFSRLPDACLQVLMRLPAAARPTAIFCANDLMALDAMRLLKQRGLDVPGDVSVVGFDDIPAASDSRPALTTVRQPLYEMGALAADQLLKQIEGLEEPGAKILLTSQRILRNSVAPPSPSKRM